MINNKFIVTTFMNMYVVGIVSNVHYRIAGFFEGENFHEFHELIAIHENFSLEIFTAGNQNGAVKIFETCDDYGDAILPSSSRSLANSVPLL